MNLTQKSININKIMKNRSIISLLILLLIFGLTACGKSELEPVNEVITPTEYATMVVNPLPESSNVASISLTIHNISEDEICYGEDFLLNILDDGVWYDIPSDPDYPEVSYGILPGEESTHELMLKERFGKLGKGHYRIMVRIDSWTHDFAVAEFDLE